MPLPVRPPLAPMLARLARELPRGDLTYEPKWDGFRCLAFVAPDGVDLRSRNDRPLARYFPEIVAGLETIRDRRAAGGSDASGFVLDGEILLAGSGPNDDGDGRRPAGQDFARLMSRLHPAATRVERLRRESPTRYVAFDILADGDEDLRDAPFVTRRARLEALVGRARPESPIEITPATRDAHEAERWLAASREGIDGVVAKPDDLRYAPGRRAMTKIKRQRTADCVLAGVRFLADGSISSLLLGLYDETDALRHVGVVTQLPRADRRSLVNDLAPLAVRLDQHPWRSGFLIGASPAGRLPGSASRWTPDMEHDWLPLRPVRVVEIGFDQVDGDRLRHPATLIRWRKDRDATSCRIDQLRSAAAGDVSDRLDDAEQTA